MAARHFRGCSAACPPKRQVTAEWGARERGKPGTGWSVFSADKDMQGPWHMARSWPSTSRPGTGEGGEGG